MKSLKIVTIALAFVFAAAVGCSDNSSSPGDAAIIGGTGGTAGHLDAGTMPGTGGMTKTDASIGTGGMGGGIDAMPPLTGGSGGGIDAMGTGGMGGSVDAGPITPVDGSMPGTGGTVDAGSPPPVDAGAPPATNICTGLTPAACDIAIRTAAVSATTTEQTPPATNPPAYATCSQ